MTQNHYNVIIVGGGISGAALYYELGRYTDIPKIALLEKYESLSTLNSSGSANSQTIHCGDIETNYTLEKARKVSRTAKMVEKYCLQYSYENTILFSHQKMAIGVGFEEAKFIRKRFNEFKELYPYMELYEKERIKEIEPALIYDEQGHEREEEVVGMGAQNQ